MKFKQLFCKHRNIEFCYNMDIGDGKLKSAWKCKYCGKILYHNSFNKNYWIKIK